MAASGVFYSVVPRTGMTLWSIGDLRRNHVDWRRDGPMERSEQVRVTLANPTEPVKIVITKLR